MLSAHKVFLDSDFFAYSMHICDTLSSVVVTATVCKEKHSVLYN